MKIPTVAEIREQILARAAAKHREPFDYEGRRFHAREPSLLEMQVAQGVYEKLGARGVLAVLATQCAEFEGKRVFQPGDVPSLLGDGLFGFMREFEKAIGPFLSEPVLPAAMAMPAKERA